MYSLPSWILALDLASSKDPNTSTDPNRLAMVSISSLTAEMESMLYCRSAEQMFWNLEPIRGEHGVT